MRILPNNRISIKVIFEDKHIIIVDKPAGIPCLPLKDGEKETIANGIVAKWLSDLPDAGLLHRLDNDTSGCLLVAKNIEAYKNLRAQFDEGKILKQYTALVLGETPAEGLIDTPIIHDPKDKKRMKVAPHGQPACTSYQLFEKFLGGRYSFLEVTIKTGVRHQIRVHLASIGHPISGDRLYQNSRQRSRDKTGLERQFLHASKLGISHPMSREWIEFTAPLPHDLRNVLTKLKNIGN